MDVVIVNANNTRRAFQEQQFSDLELPYNVMYFPGYTPESSKDYITDYDKKTKETDTTLCCFRSHIGAMRHFIHNSHADYCMIMEDDVALLRSGFQTSIDGILRAWKDHPDIDYIVVGHLLGDNPHMFGRSCDAFGWDTQGPMVWGFQAYIVRRESAARILSRFDKPTTSMIRAAVWTEIAQNGYKLPHEQRYPYLQSDSIIPAFFKAAYSKRLLGIEAPFISMISNEDTTPPRWVKHIVSGRVDPSNYYDNEWIAIVANIHDVSTMSHLQSI